MLQELVNAYAAHLGIDGEVMDSMAEADGTYSLTVGRRALCTIAEERAPQHDGMQVTLMCPLGSEPGEEGMPALLERYMSRLRCTPLYTRGHITFTEGLCVGLSCSVDSDAVTAESFPALMDSFVATVAEITAGDGGAADDPLGHPAFTPVDDAPYLAFLKSCGIEPEALDSNFGLLPVDQDFSTLLTYHDLSGLALLDNPIECDCLKALLDLLYLNGLNLMGPCYDLKAGKLHLVSSLDPRREGFEDLRRKLLTQRFMAERSLEYIIDEGRKAQALNPAEIMGALMA
ncbi:MAG: hypothetical protein K6A65_06445 [Succinivibrionaceae bacterium]|nr:hypothetical protein [Succinivibrionaceae bacterium]